MLPSLSDTVGHTHMYALVCKSEPEHFVCIQLKWLHTFEQENVAYVHLHMTCHIISVEENRFSDVLAGHLHRGGYKHEHTTCNKVPSIGYNSGGVHRREDMHAAMKVRMWEGSI